MNGDPLFLNKVIGAILTAGLLAMTAGFVANLAYQPMQLEKPAYVIGGNAPVPAPTADSAPAGPEPIAALLASADAAAGESLAKKKCKACHTFEKGGANRVGPNLWNVAGGDRAGVDGYKYSNALKEMGGKWSVADLNAFLLKPKAFAKGTKMNFPGFKKTKDRANVVLYLIGLADSPMALPK